MIRLGFNEAEEAWMEANADQMTVGELAESMYRPYSSVYAKLRKMDLIKIKKPQRYWTTNEIDYLKENYVKTRIKELAQKLDRPAISVGAYANKILKITKKI